MESQLNSRLLASYRNISRAAGGVVLAVGFLVLAGWLFDIPALKSILPGLATMKANTALSFVLAGASLLLAAPGNKNQRIDLLAKACAGVALLVGLLTLSEYIFNRDLGIDQLLFKDTLTAASAHPGRMSLATALNFSLLGSALLLLDSRPYRRLVEVLGITALLISVLALIGYAYGVPSLYQFFPYASVAIHTALAFSILCIGILFVRPEQGLMQIFSGDNLGGMMARRLTAAGVVIPFLLSWLFLTGQRMGFYDSTMRLVLSSTSIVISFAILILWNAGLLQRAEVERGQAETALSMTEQRSRALLENSWDAIALFGADGSILYGSPSTVQILGYELDEFVGRNAFELIHPEDQALVTERLTLSLQQPGVHVPIYARVLHKNGEWRWLEGVFTNLLDEPSVRAIVNNYHDFTERRQAEAAIRSNEERFRLVVEAAPSAMIAVDLDGKIDLVNARAQELFGYREEELLGQPVEMLVPKRFRGRHGSYRQTFFAQPTTRPMGARHNLFGLHKDGHEVPVEIGLTPYESSEGPFTLALIVDITEREQAEEQIRYQANLLQNVSDAVIATDPDFNITSWNSAAETLYGWSAIEVIGRPSREILLTEYLEAPMAETRERLLQRGVWKGEVIQKHRDGSRINILASTSLLKSGAGKVTGIVTVNRDITARKQAEEQFQLAVESAPNAILLADQNGRIVMVNSQTAKFFGYGRAELIGLNVDNLVPQRYRGIHPSHRQSFLANPQTRSMGAGRDLYGVRKDDSEFPVEIGLTPLETKEGLLVMATIVDITERKQAEEKFHLAVEAAPNAIVLVQRDGRISLINSQAEKFFRYDRAELIGLNVDNLVPERFRTKHGGYRAGFIADLQVRSMGSGRDLYALRKDGSEFPVEIGLTPIETREGLLVMATIVDITERKQAEEKLRWQNERLKVLREIDMAILEADSIEDVIGAALSHIRELIDCRRTAVALFDWRTNEALMFDVRTMGESSIPKGMRVPLAPFQDLIQTLSKNQTALLNDLTVLPNPTPQFQAQIKDGIRSLSFLPLFSQGALIGSFSMASEVPGFFDEEKINLGREVANQVAIAITQNHLLTTLRDLNAQLEQRVLERTAALSQANNLLQMLLDNMPDQIYFKDAQSRFIRNSRSQATALGLSDPAEAVGKSDFDFFPHAQLSYEKEQEIIRSGKPVVDEEERVVWPDGRETWVSTTKVPLPDQTGQIIGTFGISRDITERKRTEAALQKAKLELEAANKELEAFSYSVSHDLRSPLRSIDGFSQALLEDYAGLLPAEGQDHLKRVRAATQRMGQLIDDLLDLSKVTRAPMKLVPVDLSGLVRGILAELQRTQPERRVILKITPNLKALGDPGLLQAVLENLLNNAWKFTAKREQAEIEFGSRPENDETVYFIRDNGAGFDMAYVGKLFGAFQRLHAMTDFSGTGIGLATVQRVIHRHGGRIWAEGAVDRGATFFFTLPALERAKPEVPPQEKDSLAQRAREII